MAEKLNGETPGIGHNQALDRESYLGFMNELDEAEADLASALAGCREPRRRIKDIRKRITEAGVDEAGFDRARADAKKPAVVRERENQQYLQMMIWQRKPVGHQAEIFDATPPEFSVEELKAVDVEGHVAGLGGERADSNPHTPGHEAHQRWHNAWTRGQQAAVESMPEAPKKRGRGRPPKNANGNGAEASA